MYCDLLQAVRNKNLMEFVFHTCGSVNRHNSSIWVKGQLNLLHEWECDSPKVWITKSKVYGPYCLESKQQATSSILTYCRFFWSPIGLYRMPFLFGCISKRYDGAPPHFEIIVCNYLSNTFRKDGLDMHRQSFGLLDHTIQPQWIFSFGDL